MNEQQLAAVKQALEGLKECRCDPRLKYEHPFYDKVITDLEEVIAQDALYKMAEDAVTIGLSYNDWPKIGCVNHDCDQCKAVPHFDHTAAASAALREAQNRSYQIAKAAQPAPVQEPVGEVSGHDWSTGLLYRDLEPGTLLYTNPPAAQKPWVGLTDEERDELYAAHHDSCGYPITATGYEKAIEAKLKEKNHDH